MSRQLETGDRAEWKWGAGKGSGEVIRRYTCKTTLNIKGTEVTREASEQEPAYLLEQRDGDQVLKASSELEPA